MKKLLLIAIAIIGLTSCEKRTDLEIYEQSNCVVPYGSGTMGVIFTADNMAIVSFFDSEGNLTDRGVTSEQHGESLCDDDMR